MVRKNDEKANKRKKEKRNETKTQLCDLSKFWKKYS